MDVWGGAMDVRLDGKLIQTVSNYAPIHAGVVCQLSTITAADLDPGRHVILIVNAQANWSYVHSFV